MRTVTQDREEWSAVASRCMFVSSSLVLKEQRQVWWRPQLVLTTEKVASNAAVRRAHPTGQDRSSRQGFAHTHGRRGISSDVSYSPPRSVRDQCMLSNRPLPTDTLVCSSSRVRTAVGAKRWFNLIWPRSLR
jgi:hypothetical protein